MDLVYLFSIMFLIVIKVWFLLYFCVVLLFVFYLLVSCSMQCAYSFQRSTKSLKYYNLKDVFVVLCQNIYAYQSIIGVILHRLLDANVRKMPWHVITAIDFICCMLILSIAKQK